MHNKAQEPVYAIVVDKHIQHDIDTGLLEIYNSKEQAEQNTFKGATIKAIDVSTHPAPSWQGLSDSDFHEAHDTEFRRGAAWAEQILEEKNR